MEKSTMALKYFFNSIYKSIVCVFLVCFLAIVTLVCSHYSTLYLDKEALNLFINSSTQFNTSTNKSIDLCWGRYIYIHALPKRFNEGIIKNCSSLIKWFNMCRSISNMGLGPLVSKTEGILQDSWYLTNQFSLEIIFHNKMKRYKCLTNDSSLASAIFVPFYAGLDVGRHLWDSNTSVRDGASLDLIKWISKRPEWKYMWGKDHFFVGGRVSWDFRRQSDNNSDWGNKLMLIPQAKNMTMLTIESSNWENNEFAIPYPTYFHPSTMEEAVAWMRKIEGQKRHYLYSFVGARRPDNRDSIRDNIVSQCLDSSEKCRFLDCSNSNGTFDCNEPYHVMKVFLNSTFCLQPPGDSYTRRSTFDSILGGCIPVFFHPGSAYSQYIWYFPSDYTKFSIFISEDAIRNGSASVEKILIGVKSSQVLAMRKEVIGLIPRIIYSDPRLRMDDFEDAFDIAVKNILERVEKFKREMRFISKQPNL